MGRLLYILAVSMGSLLVGYLIKRACDSASFVSYDRAKRISTVMKYVALLALHPIPIMGSFWKLPVVAPSLYAIPVLGAFTLFTGGALAIVLCRMRGVAPERAASVFCCAMFQNIGIFGGLTAYVSFGDQGYFSCQLFNVFVVFIYFTVGFPVSEMIARNNLRLFRPDLAWFASNKVAFIPLTAITTGILLRSFGVERPEIMDDITSVLVPVVTGTLGFSIGITLRVGRMAMYRSELAMLCFIKYFLLPLIVIPIAWLIGLNDVMGGIPFRTVAMLTFMPVAFIAMVPPVVHDFDLDLANAGFLLSTFSMVLIFPILFYILV